MEEQCFEAWRARLDSAANRYEAARDAARKLKECIEPRHPDVAIALQVELTALKEYTRLQVAFSKALLDGKGPPPISP